MTYFNNLTRQIIKTFDLKKKEGRSGKLAIITGPSNRKYNLKLFRSSSENIQHEYDMQILAGPVAPKIYFLNKSFFIINVKIVFF